MPGSACRPSTDRGPANRPHPSHPQHSRRTGRRSYLIHTSLRNRPSRSPSRAPFTRLQWLSRRRPSARPVHENDQPTRSGGNWRAIRQSPSAAHAPRRTRTPPPRAARAVRRLDDWAAGAQPAQVLAALGAGGAARVGGRTGRRRKRWSRLPPAVTGGVAAPVAPTCALRRSAAFWNRPRAVFPAGANRGRPGGEREGTCASPEPQQMDQQRASEQIPASIIY